MSDSTKVAKGKYASGRGSVQTPPNEPTMEEILASIRRIIAEDSEDTVAPELPAAVQAPAQTSAPAPALKLYPSPQVVYDQTPLPPQPLSSPVPVVTAEAVETRARKVFLSYRRSDTQHLAGRMFDHLAARYGERNVFFDIDTIPFGVDFREHISGFLADCDMVIALIGPTWTNPEWTSPDADPEDDFVRIELDEARAQSVNILPVLADDTRMPSASLLPASIRSLARVNAPHVRGGRDFSVDIQKIISLVDALRDQADKRDKST